MGIDACIYFRTQGGVEPEFEWLMPGGFVPRRINGDYGPATATHELETHARYYGPQYERGPWPTIASALLLLYCNPDVDKVWYYGDDSDPKEFTPEHLRDMNEYWIRYGNAPYRSFGRLLATT